MKLNKIFASHMVFAKGLPIKIYGEGCGKAQISFAGQKKSIISDTDNWMIEFPPMEYGGPYSMEVSFENESIILEDIYIGEVFLFAGQSNMQFKMKESDAPSELYKSNNKLRLFSTDRIEKTDKFTPEDGWVICDKENVKDWSAIAYLTSSEILESKDIAIGVITCYQGASVIESWVPAGTFENININIPVEEKHYDHIAKDFSAWNSDGVLYSYALSQIIPFSLSAVVWYQGESDTSDAEALVYCDELCELIKVWRKAFSNEKLFFVIIQIADFVMREDNAWALVQKAQLDVQSKIPFVKTVISADVCEKENIHPKSKDLLSKRVAEILKQNI